MDLGTDKQPFCLNMTVYEAGCIIEALATKCTAARNDANNLQYENNRFADKVVEIESRMCGIERIVKKGDNDDKHT